jgi:hypothetical protein
MDSVRCDRWEIIEIKTRDTVVCPEAPLSTRPAPIGRRVWHTILIMCPGHVQALTVCEGLRRVRCGFPCEHIAAVSLPARGAL